MRGKFAKNLGKLLYFCTFALFCQAASTQAEVDNVELERCFSHESETNVARVILQANKSAIQGVEFGNVYARTHETWGYWSFFTGTSQRGVLDLARRIRVERSDENDQVTWRVEDIWLYANGLEYQSTACQPVWDKFYEWSLGAETPLRPIKVKPGQIYSFEIDNEITGHKPHDLAFTLPADDIARASFSSDPFFAVILKSAPRCAFNESDRAAVQRKFPKNKVFMDRFGCDQGTDDDYELISYENVSPESSFIAVHAGSTFAEAKILSNEMKLDQMFPGSNIREMRAVVNYP